MGNEFLETNPHLRELRIADSEGPLTLEDFNRQMERREAIRNASPDGSIALPKGFLAIPEGHCCVSRGLKPSFRAE